MLTQTCDARKKEAKRANHNTRVTNIKKKKKKWQEGSSFLEGTISFSEQTLTFWYHPGQCLDAWLWGYRSQCQDLSWTVKKVTFAAVTAPFKFFNFTSKKARKFKNAYNSKSTGSYR